MLNIFIDLSSESNYLNENSSIYVMLVAIVLTAIRTQKGSVWLRFFTGRSGVIVQFLYAKGFYELG